MKEFIEDLSRHDTAPFLFLGSGFSRRYLGTPSWDGLLETSASWMGKNFKEYISKVSTYNQEHPMYLPHLATLLAKDFSEVWWQKPEFELQREQHSSIVSDYRSALKIAISEYLGKFELVSSPDIQEELKAISDLRDRNSIDGIITTNWDCLSENIFDYKKYIGQQELLFSNVLNVGEILKIHGCITSPNSLILDEKDYESFNKRNPYLAAKLTTIFIEHPIVFIGYSIRDTNIREILDSIIYGIGSQNVNKFGRNIYFVEHDWENKGYIYSQIPIDLQNGNLDINYIRTNDFVSLYKALGQIERKFSARLVRQMKEHLYELLLTDDPKEQIYVATGLESEEDLEKIQFVYGAGIIEKVSQTGYSTYPNDVLLKDIVGIGDNNFDYASIVTKTLLIPGKNHIPVHKFIKMSKLKESEIPYRVLDRKASKHTDVISQRKSLRDMRNKINEVNDNYESLEQLINSDLSKDKILENAVYIHPSKINTEVLRNLIVINITDNGILSTHIRRLIKYYDWLKYGLNKD
ncbi:SIR2 family protein [Paenibacillus sp. An7]|uniref:SIR2 family protein n=1 Tax=Paenibacillus sp. An7 TaxID=2689577 RepID=UPI00135B695E|nr:SIR2 family protein [Paenibacillus sp. An7]